MVFASAKCVTAFLCAVWIGSGAAGGSGRCHGHAHDGVMKSLFKLKRTVLILNMELKKRGLLGQTDQRSSPHNSKAKWSISTFVL